MYQQITLAAGVQQEFNELADFLRIMKATPNDIVVIFYKQGREVSKSTGIGAGYAERFLSGDFDRIVISSATGGTVDFVMRLGNDVRFDAPPTGNVEVLNLTAAQGAFEQTIVTVTNASGQLLAANAARRYLLIQNNDAAGDVYVTLDGTAATTAKGIKIAAGGSYECQGFVPSGAVFAIGSIANNPNVVAVEG